MTQLPMRAKVVLLLLLMELLSGRVASFSSGSDEDNSLKQALFIVNLLKSEYVKVLRENIELKKSTESDIDNSTCPTTVYVPSLNTSNTSSTLISTVTSFSNSEPESWTTQPTLLNPWSKRPETSTYQPPQYNRLPTHSGTHKPYRFFRRRAMPDDRKQGKQLRVNYDDPFGEHPEETDRTTDSIPQVDTEVASPTVEVTTHSSKVQHEENPPITLPSKEKTSFSTPQTNVEDSSMPIKETTQSSRIKHDDKPPIKLSLAVPPKDHKEEKLFMKTMRKNKTAGIIKFASEVHTTTEADNVMVQVASELKNELDGEYSKHGLNKIHKWIENKGTPYFSPKSTMKVYLEGSSRFPVPLPENHAFCHTNPYNPLCRTLIG